MVRSELRLVSLHYLHVQLYGILLPALVVRRTPSSDGRRFRM